MIQQRPATTDVVRTGPWIAVLLAAGLTVGFVAGQVTPDLLGPLVGTSATVVTTDSLTSTDDYGIRHLGVTAPLSDVDDYATRHATLTPPLTGADDYGTRHIATPPPLAPADDYGVRHGSSQP